MQASEAFLQRAMALFVASHYRNTPNDLVLMSDAPAHHLFALLGPVDETKVDAVMGLPLPRGSGENPWWGRHQATIRFWAAVDPRMPHGVARFQEVCWLGRSVYLKCRWSGAQGLEKVGGGGGPGTGRIK